MKKHRRIRPHVLLAACLLFIATPPHAAERTSLKGGNILVALARDNELLILLGQYEPGRNKWLTNTQTFVPPVAHAPFSLFGVKGKIGDVHLTDEFTSRRDETPWAWNVAISTWNRSETTLALAVSGAWPDLSHPAVILSTGDAVALITAVTFLKGKNLDVASPRITQVLKVDLNGDGKEATLVCANSDVSHLTDAESADVYSLALLRIDINGQSKILPLRVQVAHKPAGQTLDDFHRHHGGFTYFQVLALADIERTGRKQIAVMNFDPDYGPEVDLYALESGKVTHPLTARVVYF